MTFDILQVAQVEFLRQLNAMPKDYDQPTGLAMMQAAEAAPAKEAAEADIDQEKLLEDALARRPDFQRDLLQGSTLKDALRFGGGRYARTVAESVARIATEIGGCENQALADLCIQTAHEEARRYLLNNSAIQSLADLHSPADFDQAASNDAEALCDPFMSDAKALEAQRHYNAELARLSGSSVIDDAIEHEALAEAGNRTSVCGPDDPNFAETVRGDGKDRSYDADPFGIIDEKAVMQTYTDALDVIDKSAADESVNALEPESPDTDFRDDVRRDLARTEHPDRIARPS